MNGPRLVCCCCETPLRDWRNGPMCEDCAAGLSPGEYAKRRAEMRVQRRRRLMIKRSAELEKLKRLQRGEW